MRLVLTAKVRLLLIFRFVIAGSISRYINGKTVSHVPTRLFGVVTK
jgi:hypothetical protein